MKFFQLIIASFILTLTVNAQNATVTDDNSYTGEESAVLDVKSDDKGVLVPRVTLNDASTADPVTSPATGLLIFNDDGTEDIGFWYWSGTEWKKIVATDANGISKPNLITAEMYEEDPSTHTTISLSNTTDYYGWVSATNGFTTGDPYISFTNNTTADRLTIGSEGAGKYRVNVSVSFGGAASSLVTGAIHKNDVLQDNLVFLRYINSNGDVGSATVNGTIDVAAGDYLDLRFNADQTNKDLKIYIVNIEISRLTE